MLTISFPYLWLEALPNCGVKRHRDPTRKACDFWRCKVSDRSRGDRVSESRKPYVADDDRSCDSDWLRGWSCCGCDFGVAGEGGAEEGHGGLFSGWEVAAVVGDRGVADCGEHLGRADHRDVGVGLRGRSCDRVV